MYRSYRINLKTYTFWIHLLVWLGYFILPLFFYESEEARHKHMIYGWPRQVFMAMYFYANYFLLIPYFLLKRKILQYSLLVIAGFFLTCLLNATYIYLAYDLTTHRFPFKFWWWFNFTIYPAIITFGLSSTIRITNEWFKNDRKRKEMEAEKLASELAFLKSQINPHFLFNILNGICSLARKKSDDTEDSIIRLASIMRYMLEDSKSEKVSLEKELTYLQSFIDLQKMRIGSEVKIIFSREGDPGPHQIEPLLLIPFVENAFKHGVSYMESSVIEVLASITGSALRFRVENKIPGGQEPSADQVSGVGLKNVTRRLELLYPGKHHLHISNDGKRYIVELNLQLK
jgi:sensor histidine kinase YesM